MTGRAAGWPEPGTETPMRPEGPWAAAGGIVLVLAAGLALRLFLALLLPGSGFGADLGLFRFWAENLAEQGPYGFYERDFHHDYTPGYLYVLWLVGLVDRIVPGDIGDLIKIPAILADLALAYVAWSMVRELGGGQRAGLVAAALIVFNPVTWFDSVTWGQVDSFGVVFLLLALRELWRDRPERSAILTVVAAIIKPQLGILVPLVAFVTIRRALSSNPPDDDADSQPTGHRTLRWERETRGPIRIVTTGLAGLITAVALSAPFGLSLPGLVEQVGSAAGGYPYLSVNAYNPWALVTFDDRGIAHNGLWACDAVVTGDDPQNPACPEGLTIGPIAAVFVGTAMLLAAVTAVSLVVARRPDRRTLLVGLAVLALVFFVVPTRVHERYLFPLFGLGAILAAVSSRWLIAYVVLSVATFANMYGVLTTPFYDNPSISDWLGIAEAIRSGPGIAIVAGIHTVGLVWAALQLRSGALARLGHGIKTSGMEDATSESGPAPPIRDPGAVPAPSRGRGDPRVAWEPEPIRRRGPPATRQSPALPATMPTWTERPTISEVGIREWFRTRLLERPIRPDRTATLHGEGRGRFDRLDLWLVAVLVLSVLGLRMWRLSEPWQMHFDEVYHARTATEFLQAWRYGIDHDIYEWTHPHLAKYAMAGGIVAWADTRASATSDLGTNVRDAALEPRYDDPLATGRAGDRIWIATGTEVRGYDLATRELVVTLVVPGAAALAIDDTAHVLVVGTDDGALLTIDLAAVDLARDGGVDVPEPIPLVEIDDPIRALHASGDGSAVIAATDGRVVFIDAVAGTTLGELELEEVVAFADAGTTPVIVASVSEVPDPEGAAGVLAELLGVELETVAARLDAAEDRVGIAILESGEDRTAIEEAITDGRLVGFSVEDQPRVAIAGAGGLTFAAPSGLEVSTMPIDGGARGLALVEGVDEPKLYVAAGTDEEPIIQVVTVGGDNLADKPPTAARTLPMPGPVVDVAYDDPTQQVHVLGRTTDGEASTVYVVEPHANAVYADARLPFEPVAWALDANSLYPSDDRQQILAFAPDGAVASVEAGQQPFGWRMPGVLAGALMAGLLYVLARILFQRREIAIAAGVVGLLDGMLFVQSRIGMNDAYVAVFIVAAYTLFAALWMGVWRSRVAFWVTMPAIGLLLGLALSAKWVAAFAIGALGILILARSALGRLVLIAGMIVVTTVLGYLAVTSVPEAPNLTFMLIMIALTVVAAVVNVLHPVAWSSDEVRFAIAAPAAAGLIVFLGALALGLSDARIAVGSLSVTPVTAGFGLVLASLGVAAALWLAGRLGYGPLARPPAAEDPVRLLEPPSPPPPDWLRPGWALGLPVAWMVACLLVIPVAVYVASYVPWALLDSHRLVPGWPNGHTGQTLVELTGAMYNYHNNLPDPHAASSPWWAWPFDLKPVWFYQDSFAGGTAAAVYDAGNLASWWLGVPAMAFVAWQAFKRRSLALSLIAIGFACQWIAWARIDRAAFQYHYYTSLPFLFLALGYFLAEVWHGASRRTWLLARLAAAAAIVAPAAMWLLHRPLCGFVRVTDAVQDSRACPTVIPDFVLTPGTAVLAIVVGIAAIVVVRQLARLDPSLAAGGEGADRSGLTRFLPGGLGPLILTGLVAAVVLIAVTRLPEGDEAVRLTNVPVEPVALLVSIPLFALAAFVATARDARRFVLGVFVAIAATFIVWYPNLAALPMPSALVNAYQGVIPTYLYPFQFPVNTAERSAAGSVISPASIAVLIGLTAVCLVFAYSASVWRQTMAERRAADLAGDGPDAYARPSGGRA